MWSRDRTQNLALARQVFYCWAVPPAPGSEVFCINLSILVYLRFCALCSVSAGLSPPLFSPFFPSSHSLDSCLIGESLCLFGTQRVESGGGKDGKEVPWLGEGRNFWGTQIGTGSEGSREHYYHYHANLFTRLPLFINLWIAEPAIQPEIRRTCAFGTQKWKCRGQMIYRSRKGKIKYIQKDSNPSVI